LGFSPLIRKQKLEKKQTMFIRVTPNITLSSACLWGCFHPYPLFQWHSQSKGNFIKSQYEISRVIIVVVQVEAVKIYCISLPPKVGGKTSLGSSNFAL
jgi:hypothetical protein